VEKDDVLGFCAKLSSRQLNGHLPLSACPLVKHPFMEKIDPSEKLKKSEKK